MRSLVCIGSVAVLALAGLGCIESRDLKDGCTYAGKRREAGDRFPSVDGCNDCVCEAGGAITCTKRACVDSGSGVFTWYATCGAPVCGPGTDGPTGQPPCTDEVEGARCAASLAGELCDPGRGCGVNLLCSDEDPTAQPGGCPISRARYKQGIRYVDTAERSALAEALMTLPLARYRYADARPSGEQLGFLIEDVGAVPSVEGDHVNLYGYTSMAVAALQEQDARVRALETELSVVRAALAELEQRCPPP